MSHSSTAQSERRDPLHSAMRPQTDTDNERELCVIVLTPSWAQHITWLPGASYTTA